MKDAMDEPDRIPDSILRANQSTSTPIPTVGLDPRISPDKELSLLVANIIALIITAAVMTVITFGLVTLFQAWSASPL